ncbi:MAG: molecular chaperone TorD family protein [Alphaproteobacteria bacterium]|nr:molecular chaperone TorD family protein [Alphaproteobacteria bacterium]
MNEHAPVPADPQTAPGGGLASAFASDLTLLARFHDRELDSATLETLASLPVAQWLSLRLQGPLFEEASRLIETALGGISDCANRAVLDELAAEYAAIYLTHAYRASPVESVWRDDELLERQAAMFAVRDWYRHFGVTVPDWRKRSDDHIAHELEFAGRLLEAGASAGQFGDAARFLRDHPLVWVPEFCTRVSQRCRLKLYAGFALLTLAYIHGLADFLGQASGLDMTPPPLRLSAVAPLGRSTPTCADPP